MALPLVTKTQLEEVGFFTTNLTRKLTADPIGIIDVGARWGVDELFRPIASLASILAFEPDAEEALRVEEREANAAWAGFHLSRKALGDASGRVNLHLLARSNNSSLYPVDPMMAKRYQLAGFEPKDTIKVDVAPLDDIVFDARTSIPRAGEVIKIDVQGAEADVIRGASRTLKNNTICVIAEVHFFAPYKGIELFSEIELALRAHGFSFIGFLDIQNRSTKRLNKRQCHGRERIMQADAVFVRDPIGRPVQNQERSITVCLTMALLLGYFDYAMELADVLDPSDRERFLRAIPKLASVNEEVDAHDIAELSKAAKQSPSDAHIALSKIVDRRRDFATIHDIEYFRSNS